MLATATTNGNKSQCYPTFRRGIGQMYKIENLIQYTFNIIFILCSNANEQKAEMVTKRQQPYTASK